ncbi:unnamed protein product [Parnassius apollo]|nr:unnamed protein product [Parnassius apollo]CAG5030408.1 unnamed protein product [Parnassius apollo]
MSISSFEELLSELSKYIQKKKNKGRKPVTALEMLGLTLRFLATGSDFKTMHTNYFRGASTIAKIVRTVCRAIWKHLSSQNIPPITKQVLEDVAIEFDKKANFPNCIGALDGFVTSIPQTTVFLNRRYKQIDVNVRHFNFKTASRLTRVVCKSVRNKLHPCQQV